MKKALISLLFLIIFFASDKNSLAIYDPLSTPNNRVGIHVFSEKDLEDVVSLVNSQGGDWGYVTLVITEGERDHDRWQKVFDQMRRLHLIPIVRLATKGEGETWQKPRDEEIENWIAFLNSLNWVIKNRYIVIANEPNHAKEWGGEIKPGEYATYLKKFSQRLKSVSDDFFILPAGLDASARNTRLTMEESAYIKEMLKAESDVFEHIDGWNSHSYPNPDFSGSEKDQGKGTINSFDWELTYLKSLGVEKKLPVFITETGWSNHALAEDLISQKTVYAYQSVWSDERIVAVTPFILNYPNPPFDNFSWKDKSGKFNLTYSRVKELSKTKGEPKQIEKGQILAAFAQPIILSGSDFVGAVLAKNTGQSIWNSKQVAIGTDSGNLLINSSTFNDIEPMRLGLIIFKAASPDNTGLYSSSLFLKGSNGGTITNSFLLEAWVTKIDKVQRERFFARIGGYLRSIFRF